MKKNIISQFWIGNIETKDRFFSFFSENDEYWSEENEINETIPLSEFVGSQGKRWLDHDFFEAGYSEEGGAIFEKFKSYSWAKLWAPLIESKMAECGIAEINTFVMVGVDQRPDGTLYRQFKNPVSCTAEGVDLTYIGEIEHVKA